MIEFSSSLSALIFCYFLSRATWRLLRQVAAPVRLLAAHALSFGLLYLFIGLWKSYFLPFAFDEARVVLLPQLAWLAFDVLRGRLRNPKAPRSGSLVGRS